MCPRWCKICENPFKNQNESFFNDNEQFDLDLLLNFFIRRKKIILFTFILSFSAITTFNIYKRIFHPVYAGSFTLLISDPLNPNNQRRSSSINNSFITDIARNSTSSDIPTLVQVLQSSVLLKPLAEKFDYKISELKGILNISIPETEFRNSPRVLYVAMYEKNKLKLARLVEDLSKLYLENSFSD